MPANDYYDSTGAPSSNSVAASATIRGEFNLVETGFTATQAALALKASTAALALKADLISPVLITPNIGTPSAGVVTYLSGTAALVSIGGNAATATLASTVTTNANLTGHITSTGNAAVLGSFTLAQLNTAISDADVTTGGGTATGTNTGDQTNISGNAATVTTNANLTGDVTSVGNATTLTNAPVIAKVLTGYVSGAGTVAATDSILAAIQKLNGNNATNANLTGPITSTGNGTAIASQTGTGTTFAMSASPTFTGTVTIPTPFTLGAVSVLPTGTELNFVDGVTSNIQTQLSAKAPILVWSIKTTTYTAVAGDALMTNTTAAAFTITLPAAPAANDVVDIADYAGTFGTNNLTIARNALKIMSLAEDMTVSVNNVKFRLVYIDVTVGWRTI